MPFLTVGCWWCLEVQDPGSQVFKSKKQKTKNSKKKESHFFDNVRWNIPPETFKGLQAPGAVSDWQSRDTEKVSCRRR